MNFINRLISVYLYNYLHLLAFSQFYHVELNDCKRREVRREQMSESSKNLGKSQFWVLVIYVYSILRLAWRWDSFSHPPIPFNALILCSFPCIIVALLRISVWSKAHTYVNTIGALTVLINKLMALYANFKRTEVTKLNFFTAFLLTSSLYACHILMSLMLMLVQFEGISIRRYRCDEISIVAAIAVNHLLAFIYLRH